MPENNRTDTDPSYNDTGDDSGRKGSIFDFLNKIENEIRLYYQTSNIPDALSQIPEQLGIVSRGSSYEHITDENTRKLLRSVKKRFDIAGATDNSPYEYLATKLSQQPDWVQSIFKYDDVDYQTSVNFDEHKFNRGKHDATIELDGALGMYMSAGEEYRKIVIKEYDLSQTLWHEMSHNFDALAANFDKFGLSDDSDAWKEELDMTKIRKDIKIATQAEQDLFRHTSQYGKAKHAREAFAEVGAKYMETYAELAGDETKIDQVMSKTYKDLWPVYRDESLYKLENIADALKTNAKSEYLRQAKGADVGTILGVAGFASTVRAMEEANARGEDISSYAGAVRANFTDIALDLANGRKILDSGAMMGAAQGLNIVAGYYQYKIADEIGSEEMKGSAIGSTIATGGAMFGVSAYSLSTGVAAPVVMTAAYVGDKIGDPTWQIAKGTLKGDNAMVERGMDRLELNGNELNYEFSTISGNTQLLGEVVSGVGDMSSAVGSLMTEDEISKTSMFVMTGAGSGMVISFSGEDRNFIQQIGDQLGGQLQAMGMAFGEAGERVQDQADYLRDNTVLGEIGFNIPKTIVNAFRDETLADVMREHDENLKAFEQQVKIYNKAVREDDLEGARTAVESLEELADKLVSEQTDMQLEAIKEHFDTNMNDYRIVFAKMAADIPTIDFIKDTNTTPDEVTFDDAVAGFQKATEDMLNQSEQNLQDKFENPMSNSKGRG